MEKIRLGLLGLGEIGSGVYSILTEKRNYFLNEIGVDFEIRKIAVRHPLKKRKIQVRKSLLTDDPKEVVRDPSVDVVVELIGGVTEARSLIKEALDHDKHVVTANKALLAEYGREIFELAVKHHCWIFFEASVGGGIPVMKSLREGLVANRVESIYCIINGTSNYILSRMTERHADFMEALREAQDKGYAEADPRLDIEGTDSAHKLAILMRFAFNGNVRFQDIYCEGISRIRSEDIEFAEGFGYRVKLLAIAKATAEGIEARVQPTLLPGSHILANVHGSNNAILLRGDEIGDVLLYGKGAGSRPTASAVVSDLVDIAKRRSRRYEEFVIPLRAIEKPLKIKSMSSILSRYYLRFHVIDRPGVLAKISQILGTHSISISDCYQKERSRSGAVPLILITHDTHERQVREAIRAIDRLSVVRGKSQVIRIEANA